MVRSKLLLISGFAVLLTTLLVAVAWVFKISQKSVSAQPISPVYEEAEVSPQPTHLVSLTNISPSPIPQKINILLLGLDGRKGDYRPRCDAIHMMTLDAAQKKLRITSIPRGTPVEIADIEKERAYISNSCHILGLDFAIAEIEKISGVKKDYLVKLGFSQAMGIFRTFGLPTSDTLQFLRNRHLAGGDVQRSKNQAQFMKDMIVKNLHTYSNIPKPIRYLLFKMVDTDMEFEEASVFADQLLAMEIDKYPERIELVTRPLGLYTPKEMHLSSQSTQVGTNSAEEFQVYQNDMETYLGNLFVRADELLKKNQTGTVYNIVNTPFHQQLWLQLEDENKRHQWHFELLRLFALSTPNKNERNTVVLDFMTEMEALGLPQFEQQGRSLFASLP